MPPGLPANHRSKYLLARAVIKRHLTLRLPASNPDVQVNTFPSLESEEFKAYLHLTPVHFVMMHDGSSRSRKVSESTNDDEKFAKALLRGIIWWWNTHRLNVSLINRIEFRDSKVFTMIVESFTASSKQILLASDFKEDIEEIRDSLEQLRSTGEPAQEVEPTDIEELSECPPGITSSENFYLAAYGVSELLQNEDCDVFLASAFILHTVTLKHVAVTDRRLPLIRFDELFEEKIDTFLAKLSTIFQKTMEHETWEPFMAKRGAENDTIDLVDGRVFRAVIQAMCDDKSLEQSLPTDATKDWKILCRIVMHLAEEELLLEGSTGPASSETKLESETASENISVLPFSHPVFDKHLECIHVEADTSVPARLGAMQLYRETTHWHNYNKPLNPKVPLQVKVSKWR